MAGGRLTIFHAHSIFSGGGAGGGVGLPPGCMVLTVTRIIWLGWVMFLLIKTRREFPALPSTSTRPFDPIRRVPIGVRRIFWGPITMVRRFAV